MIQPKLLKQFLVEPGSEVNLKEYVTDWTETDEAKELGKEAIKERAAEILEESKARLAEAQDLLYAADTHSVLIVLQAMDAAGKDGTIRHVMSGVNPQGCQVTSFKAPSSEELAHSFLWRTNKALPERGMIGIFNRSYYEEVLVVRVHPAILEKQNLPDEDVHKDIWKHRYEDINAMERHLARNGTTILKFFLNVSKEEQKKRFLERLDTPEKNWKFSSGDITERAYWDDYMAAFEEAITATSTEWAPWYVIPADHKWAMRAAVADIITTTIKGLPLAYPTMPDDEKGKLAESREKLLAED